MSSYAQCWLGDFYLGSSRNEIDPNLMALFRASDKILLKEPIPDLTEHLRHYREQLEKDGSLRIIYFEAPGHIARDRLDIMGYTFSTSKQAFQQWISGELEHNREMIRSMQLKNGELSELMTDFYQREIEILAALTPESWIEGLTYIRSSGLQPNTYGRYEKPRNLIDYMLSKDWYGFPGYDSYVPLRLAIEACEAGANLIYDLTELVWSQYYDYEDDFIEYGMDISSAEYASKARIIVLTEGKTDAWILTESLKILYPHLYDYFSFLDFELTGFGGGVGNLANIVKAFAGTGIVNSIIALFDNDTAAAAACKTLHAVRLPSNIVIRQLPELPLLKEYPTIGPSGEITQNVNGIAASIELYLGEDVLRGESGHLVPVQWTGYDRGMNRYQGEVIDKPELHKRFRRKMENSNGVPGDEWDGLRAVFNVIFHVFDEKQRHLICEYPRDYFSR